MIFHNTHLKIVSLTSSYWSNNPRSPAVVLTTPQCHSKKPELKFCIDSSSSLGVLEVCNNESLRQYLQVEIRLKIFRLSTIVWKQLTLIKYRPIERGPGGPAAPPRFLLTSIFDKLKKTVLKQKIVQSYKTSWNSSKFIDIYNIIIDLDTRGGILPVMNSKRFFSFLTVHSL